MAQWYDEDMPGQDDGYERYNYPERFEDKVFTPENEDSYDIMYRNLREGKNTDGTEPEIKVKPILSSIWQHHNGIIYQVLHIANEDSTNIEYPETVVFKGGNEKVWCKTTDNFLAKMTKLDVTRNLNK